MTAIQFKQQRCCGAVGY